MSASYQFPGLGKSIAKHSALPASAFLGVVPAAQYLLFIVLPRTLALGLVALSPRVRASLFGWTVNLAWRRGGSFNTRGRGLWTWPLHWLGADFPCVLAVGWFYVPGTLLNARCDGFGSGLSYRAHDFRSGSFVSLNGDCMRRWRRLRRCDIPVSRDGRHGNDRRWSVAIRAGEGVVPAIRPVPRLSGWW